MGRLNPRWRRRKRGMAMVEMVFVLPVLLLLVFSIAELGLMFQRWLTLSNAVREGARYAIRYRGTPAACAAQGVPSQVQQIVVDYANAGGVGIAPGDVNVSGVCTGTGTAADVDASYDYFFQVLPGLSPLGQSITLQYAAQMRNE